MATQIRDSISHASVSEEHGLFQLLCRLANDIAGSLETDAILRTAADGLLSALQASRVTVRRFPEIGEMQIVTEACAPEVSSFGHYSVAFDSPLLAKLKSCSKPVVYSEPRKSELPEILRDYLDKYAGIAGYSTFIFCPLIVDGTMWGSLSVHGDSNRNDWKQAEIELTSAVSGQLSAAIKNSRLYQLALDGKRRVEASEEYLQKVIASINYGVVAIEQDYRIAYANPLMERMLGYTLAELRELDIFDLMASESAKNVEREFNSRRFGNSGTYEIELVNRQDERIPVLISAAPITVHDKFHGSVSVVTDLRERRRLEEQLRRTEKSRLSLIESAPLAMVVADYKGRIKYVNPGFQRVFGYTQADVEQCPSLWRKLVVPEDSARMRQEMMKMVKSDHFYEVEYRCRAKDGRVLWLSQTTLPLRDRNGTIIGFESWATDISKRKRAEEQVKRLVHTVESIGELVIASDLQGVITYANRAALSRLGYSYSELIGKPESSLRSSTGLADQHLIERTLPRGWQGETRYKTSTGEVFPVYLTTSPITDEDGKSVAIVGIARDISDQKKAEARRQRHQKQLVAINRAGRTISSILDATDSLRVVTDCLARNFGASDVIACLIDNREESAPVFSLVAMSGQTKWEDFYAKVSGPETWPPLKRAAMKRRPFFGRYIFSEKNGVEEASQNHSRYYAVYPLIVTNQTLGLLTLFSNVALEPDERELIESLVGQTAITIEKARLFAAQQDEVEITRALLEVATIIGARDNPTNIMERIVAVTGRLLGADACVHFQFDDKNDVFIPYAQHGIPSSFMDLFRHSFIRPMDSQVASAVFYERKPIIVEDVKASELTTSELLKSMSVCSIIVLPLTAKSRFFGTINVMYRNKIHRFTQKEIAIAEGIAAHTAVALDNAELYSEVEAHRLELISLSRKVVEAQEEERRRISRELHDEAGQALTAIKINIEMVERELPEASTSFRRRLVEARELVDLTLKEVRRLSHELRPSILDDLGLLPALRWYTHNFSIRTGIAVSLMPEELPERLPPEIETILYRVVQEALTNVIKHSGAKLVTMNLYRNKGQCRLIVSDDGHGIESSGNSGDGIGLLGMRERVRLFGGTVVLESLERGAQLIVDLPVESVSISNS